MVTTCHDQGLSIRWSRPRWTSSFNLHLCAVLVMERWRTVDGDGGSLHRLMSGKVCSGPDLRGGVGLVGGGSSEDLLELVWVLLYHVNAPCFCCRFWHWPVEWLLRLLTLRLPKRVTLDFGEFMGFFPLEDLLRSCYVALTQGKRLHVGLTLPFYTIQCPFRDLEAVDRPIAVQHSAGKHAGIESRLGRTA